MYFCYRVKLATSETLQTNLATIDHLQKREQSEKIKLKQILKRQYTARK